MAATATRNLCLVNKMKINGEILTFKKNPFALYVREYETHTHARHTFFAIAILRDKSSVVGFDPEDPAVVV